MVPLVPDMGNVEFIVGVPEADMVIGISVLLYVIQFEVVKLDVKLVSVSHKLKAVTLQYRVVFAGRLEVLV